MSSPIVATCSHAPSRMRSSASTRAGSRSRRTSRTGSRRSRSSGWPIARARRRRRACARASPPPSSSGPRRAITINLAPAALRKEGSGFDLPIALAVLAASYQVPARSLDGHAAFGELGLDGRLRPVPGALVAAEGARRAGLTHLVCAFESAPEVALAGVAPVGVRHLGEAVSYLRGEHEPPEPPPPDDDFEVLAVRPRPRRRSRPGTRAARARDRRCRRPQPAARGTARHRQDDARAPASRPAAAPRRRCSARGDAHPLGQRHPRTGSGARARAAVPRASPLELSGGRDRRRRRFAAARRGEPRSSRRAVSRRDARVPAAGARGTSPTARGRCRVGGAGLLRARSSRPGFSSSAR